MQFSKLNFDKPENVYRTILNVEGATITTGMPVSLINTSTDGVKGVIANATGDYPGFVGVALTDIANNQYGRIQISGFVNSVLLSNAGTSITINQNDPLIPSPAGFYSNAGFSGNGAYALCGFKVLFASNTPAAVSASAYASGLIKNI